MLATHVCNTVYYLLVSLLLCFYCKKILRHYTQESYTPFQYVSYTVHLQKNMIITLLLKAYAHVNIYVTYTYSRKLLPHMRTYVGFPFVWLLIHAYSTVQVWKGACSYIPYEIHTAYIWSVTTLTFTRDIFPTYCMYALCV